MTDEAATIGDADNVDFSSSSNEENNEGGRNITLNNNNSASTSENANENKQSPAISTDDVIIGTRKEGSSNTFSFPDSGTVAKTTTHINRLIDKVSQPRITPNEEPMAKPLRTEMRTTITQGLFPPPVTSTSPIKRPIALAADTSELKRAKIGMAPTTSSIPITVSRNISGSSSQDPLSIERQVTEQRMKLLALRKKRVETAKKQTTIDDRLKPFKQRMAEELKKLNHEMMAEEIAYSEEKQRYIVSVEMLNEFQKADRGA